MLSDTPLDPRDLVDSLWSPSDLPDYRLWLRLRTSAVLLFDRLDDPTATQPRAPRLGLQRFCNNPRVDTDRLTKNAQARTLQGLIGHQLLLLAHDTTEVNMVGRAEPDDAGPLRSNAARGYLVHSSVAVDPQHHSLLGVVDAHAWTRTWRLRGQDHKTRAPHRKESFKWRRGIRRAVAAALAAGVTCPLVHALDREGDVHENFTFARKNRHLVVVRAAQDRLIAEGGGTLWEYLASCDVARVMQHDVRTEVSVAALAKAKAVTKAATEKATEKGAAKAATTKAVTKTATAKAAKATAKAATAKAGALTAVERLEARVAKLPARRTATVQIRFADVTLTPPAKHKRRKPVGLTAISIREDDPPADVEPIDWVLLTTCPVSNAAEALAVMGYYDDRYLIEPMHRIWKSALHLEQSPVSDVGSFRRLLSVLMPMATHIAQWTYAARDRPQSAAASHVTPEVLLGLKEACRYHRLPLPRRAWTIGDVVLRLARLGGYEPRPDRRPGWIVIWRGWRELRRFTALFDYAQSRRKEAPG